MYEKLNKAYENRKPFFHSYINNIKKNMVVDFFTITNTTLIRDPHNTSFPKKFFLEEYTNVNRVLEFFKSSFYFYIRQFYCLGIYFLSYCLFKINYKRRENYQDNSLLIDIFFLVDNIIRDKKLNENYFKGIYDILNKNNQKFIFLPRLVGINKNPFKLLKVLKILNDDERSFLFDFELLSFKDFITISFLILQYPFKTLRLIQKEAINEDRLFNNELLCDIKNFNFEAFTRYILGKNISKLKYINKVYSWSEFQAIERSFNYAVRMSNNNIKLYGCQFYLNFETYFSNKIEDIDEVHKTSFHKVLVNSPYYILERNKVDYSTGVSLRYKDLFLFDGILSSKDIIILGTHLNETRHMLNCIPCFDKVLFKSHPSINIKLFGKFSNNILPVNQSVYELFKNARIIITTASGTALEAVACGIPVIIIGDNHSLLAHPLVKFGKGKIWDLAFSKDDVFNRYNELIKFKKENKKEIDNIANWYKENFFVEPNEENIKKVFDIGGN